MIYVGLKLKMLEIKWKILQVKKKTLDKIVTRMEEARMERMSHFYIE